MSQAVAGRPVRVRVGKARKGGSSTFWQTLFAFVLSVKPLGQAYCVSHREETRDALARIGSRSARGSTTTDEFIQTIHRYPNGSWQAYVTSGGQSVGAGDTLSLLHWSERAKWGLKKQDTAHDTAIAAEWADIIIDESTFKGRDDFWSDFDRARKQDTGYVPVFVAWYEDDRCRIDCERFEPDDYEAGLVEQAAREGVAIDHRHLGWRRQKIAQLGEDTFRQEYPSSPEEAIQASKGVIFPGSRLWRIDDVPFDYLSIPWNCRVGGIDFGYNDPCVIWSGVYWDQTLYLMQFWRGRETLAEEQANGLVDGHTYYCDPANLSDRKELAKAAAASGLHVKLLPAPRRTHKGQDQERSEIHRMIEFAAAGKLRVLHEVSDQLIIECDDLAWNEQTSKPHMQRSEECGHYDAIMAAKYAMLGVTYREPSAQPLSATDPPVTRRREFLRC